MRLCGGVGRKALPAGHLRSQRREHTCLKTYCAYICYLPPQKNLGENGILILQMKKPKLREAKYHVQDYPAIKRRRGNANCGLPHSIAHTLSNTLVLYILPHVMTHREENTATAHWGKWRRIHHPRPLKAIPRNEGVIISGPHATPLGPWLGSSPTHHATLQSDIRESHSASQQWNKSIYHHSSLRSGASSLGWVLSQS